MAHIYNWNMSRVAEKTREIIRYDSTASMITRLQLQTSVFWFPIHAIYYDYTGPRQDWTENISDSDIFIWYEPNFMSVCVMKQSRYLKIDNLSNLDCLWIGVGAPRKQTCMLGQFYWHKIIINKLFTLHNI